MNADQGDITLDSPEAFLLKTSGFAVAAILTPQISSCADPPGLRRAAGGHPDVI
jgi:hypothetical protein